MDLLELLKTDEQRILEAATQAIGRGQLTHYAKSSAETNRQRLRVLFGLVRQCIEQHTLLPMLEYVESVAEERFLTGFDLQEVQCGFNVLEEVIWREIAARLEPAQYPQAFGLAATVLGAGRDALARRYVSLASSTHVPSLDLSALFEGTAAAVPDVAIG